MTSFWGFAQDDYTLPYGGPPKQAILGNHSIAPLMGAVGGYHGDRLGQYNNLGPAVWFHPGDTANWLFVDQHVENVGTYEEVSQKISDGDIDMHPPHN
jgi:hypothetical protein